MVMGMEHCSWCGDHFYRKGIKQIDGKPFCRDCSAIYIEQQQTRVIQFTQNIKEFDSNVASVDTIVKIFTGGLCWYFASIVQKKFGGAIYYSPLTNHFACFVYNKLYDITGEISEHGYLCWDTMELDDDVLVGRLITQCIDKGEI
jgi:hypothetical protein